jgi:hypothetical protein
MHGDPADRPHGLFCPILNRARQQPALTADRSRKEIRRGIWRCCRSWFPERLPALSDVELWQDILWPECGKLTLEQVAAFIETEGSIETLTAKVKGKDAHAWLNEFYATLKREFPVSVRDAV